MKKHKRHHNQVKDDKRKEYDDMATSRADMTDFRRPPYAVKRAIQAQAEQIHEAPAEYIARKFNIRSGADDRRTDEEDT